MAARGAIYEVLNVATRTVLSRHRTRQAAIDTWRQQHTGIAVEIWRRNVPRGDALIVEGIWHDARRRASEAPIRRPRLQASEASCCVERFAPASVEPPAVRPTA
jgi:hypothetical protein